MSLAVFQIAALAVLAAAYAVTLWGARDRRRRALEIAALAVAAWLGEHSCIELYGFYHYADGWWLRLGHVPAWIPLIWPMVVLSAGQVQRALFPQASRLRRAALVALIVVFDASLMEVLAVAAGYWRWVEGGYFGVPLMGIAGWGCFAFVASAWLEAPRLSLARLAALPPVAAAGAHLLILATWWLALRWVLRGELERSLALAGFATASLLMGVQVLRARRAGRALDGELTASRVLATSVFVALLCSLEGSIVYWLSAHFALVALPYLLATRWSSLWLPARAG